MTKTENFDQIEVTSSSELREWLLKNHAEKESIWLVTYKKETIEKYVSIQEVLDQLLCFGNISMYNPESNERFYDLVRALQSQGKSLQEAQQMAAGAMEGAVSTQAAIISYAKEFLLVGIICLAVLPLVFFAKIKKGEIVYVSGTH